MYDWYYPLVSLIFLCMYTLIRIKTCPSRQKASHPPHASKEEPCVAAPFLLCSSWMLALSLSGETVAEAEGPYVSYDHRQEWLELEGELGGTWTLFS